MRAILSACMLATLLTGTAHADCAPPPAAISIPDGATANRDEMVAAQHAVKAYDTAVKAYGDCLQHQLDTKVAAGGDRTQLAAEYDRMNNVEVDRLQKLADKFNAELRIFKAKNSG